MESCYASLEKILSDISKISQEETAEQKCAADIGKKMHSQLLNWPSTGSISFENLCMGYRDLPAVLKDVSFKIMSGEKVGICGRTGCGLVA